MSEELVWYASYGSNLNRDRFMCYIDGDEPECSRMSHGGCSDRTPPRDDRSILLPYGLLFAMGSSRWEGKGVAFIDPENMTASGTLGRMYLITWQQFVQITRQENGLKSDDPSLDVDMEEAITAGDLILSSGMYGRMLHVGSEMPHPIFTFTSPTADDLEPIAPGEKYLRTIVRGLIETYGMDDAEIALYLKGTTGIRGMPVEDDLERIIAESRSE